jgi:hypothetical protein
MKKFLLVLFLVLFASNVFAAQSIESMLTEYNYIQLFQPIGVMQNTLKMDLQGCKQLDEMTYSYKALPGYDVFPNMTLATFYVNPSSNGYIGAGGKAYLGPIKNIDNMVLTEANMNKLDNFFDDIVKNVFTDRYIKKHSNGSGNDAVSQARGYVGLIKIIYIYVTKYSGKNVLVLAFFDVDIYKNYRGEGPNASPRVKSCVFGIDVMDMELIKKKDPTMYRQLMSGNI